MADPAGTVTTELLPTLAGYIPPGNHGKPVTLPKLSLSQLDAAVGGYLVNTYQRRVHPETGQTPADRWAAGDWLPRMPQSLEELDLLLLPTGALPPTTSPCQQPPTPSGSSSLIVRPVTPPSGSGSPPSTTSTVRRDFNRPGDPLRC